MKTLYAEMDEAGLVTGSHCSDLYVKATPEARAIIKRHDTAPCLLSWFTDQITGVESIDVSFAYAPFWESVSQR